MAIPPINKIHSNVNNSFVGKFNSLPTNRIKVKCDKCKFEGSVDLNRMTLTDINTKKTTSIKCCGNFYHCSMVCN